MESQHHHEHDRIPDKLDVHRNKIADTEAKQAIRRLETAGDLSREQKRVVHEFAARLTRRLLVDLEAENQVPKREVRALFDLD